MITTNSNKLYIYIYNNRYWLLALLLLLTLAYFPTFQYDYLVLDDYTEIYKSPTLLFDIIYNGRVLQFPIQYIQHLLFTYGNEFHYFLLRLFVFILAYIFAALMYLFFAHLVFAYLANKKLYAFALSAFIFTTPQFSIFFQWADISFIVVSSIMSIISFYLFTYYFYKSYANSVFLFLMFFIMLAIVGMVFQPSIFLPLFFIVCLLLLKKDFDLGLNDVSLRTIISSYFKFEIIVLCAVIFGSILYFVCWKFQIFYVNYLVDSHLFGKVGLRTFYDSDKTNIVFYLLYRLGRFILIDAVSGFAWFSFLGNFGAYTFYILFLLLGAFTIYKEIFYSESHLRKVLFIKWGIIFLSFCISFSLGLLQAPLRVLYVYNLIVIVLFIYFAYSVFDVENLFDKVATMTTKNVELVKSYFAITAIGLFVYFNIGFNLMGGFVYYNSVEQLYIRANLINQLASKPEATTLYIKPIEKTYCYFGVCLKELKAQGYGMIGTAWYREATFYAFDRVGINSSNFDIIDQKIYNSTSELLTDYPKLDLNKTIVIDMQGLHKAFIATYGK